MAYRFATLLFGLAAMLCATRADAPRAAAPVPFKIGIAAPTVNMLPLWLGKEAGLFAARGFDVEIVSTAGGGRGLAEVGEGRLNAMSIGLSGVIDANSKGGDYRLIASGANSMNFRFFGAKGIDSAAALKGKKVGVSGVSESDTATSLALRRLGLTRADVTVVEAGNPLQRLEALRSAAIAATPLNEPADTQATREGMPLLVDLKSDLPWIFTAVAVDRRWLAANREQAKELLRAYVEAIYLALNDGARAKRVLASEFRDLRPEVVDAAYEDFGARVPRDAALSREGAEIMLRELPALGTPIKSTNPADYIDETLIGDLRREGFFEMMKTKYGVQ